MKTYYTVLGISINATTEEIAAAYHNQRVRYSEERIAELGADFQKIAEQRMAELDLAYATLSDPVQRSAYNTSINQQPRLAVARNGLTRREFGMAGAGVLAGLLIITVVWIVSGLAAEPALPPVGELRRPAFAFEVPGLDQPTVRLSDYRGKVVLVNFWGTWCEPCKEETPAIQAAYQNLRDQGLVVIGVNLRKQEPGGEEAVREFVQRYGVTYPIALDVEGEIARSFQISPIPVSYFIDQAGTIRYVRVGTLTTAEIEALFRRLQQDAVALR